MRGRGLEEGSHLRKRTQNPLPPDDLDDPAGSKEQALPAVERGKKRDGVDEPVQITGFSAGLIENLVKASVPQTEVVIDDLVVKRDVSKGNGKGKIAVRLFSNLHGWKV